MLGTPPTPSANSNTNMNAHTVSSQVGDTPDDVRAGVAAGTVAMGVLVPTAYAACVAAGGDPAKDVAMAAALAGAGAARVLRPGLAELLDVLAPV